MAANCSYEIYIEQVDSQFEGLQEESLLSEDYFNVQLSVNISPYIPTQPQLPILSPFPTYRSSVLTVPGVLLLHHGQTFLRNNIPDIVPDDLINMVTPRIISYTNELVEDWDNDSLPFTLTFALYINLEVPCEEEDVMDWITRVSMQEELVRMVPAKKEAIASLEVVKHEEGAKTDCSICMEEFDESEFLAMPCNHAFHKNCIVQWLETSHMCPL